jgi:hypothetical protein
MAVLPSADSATDQPWFVRPTAPARRAGRRAPAPSGRRAGATAQIFQFETIAIVAREIGARVKSNADHRQGRISTGDSSISKPAISAYAATLKPPAKKQDYKEESEDD